MINFCIVEDDDATAAVISDYLRKFYTQYKQPVKVVRFADADHFLRSDTSNIDAVFMDIELPGTDGMKAVKELRKKDSEVAVIFITNLAQYAVSGYEVNAFDFMVKPVSYGGFTMKLRRLCQYLAAKRKCEICVSTRHGKFLVKADDIKYVEVMRHVVTYNTVKGKVVGSGTLKQVMETLKGLPFALCNRCYLVNLRYVTQIVGREVTVGGDSLLISAPRSREFMAAFNRYLSTGGKVK